MNRINTMTGSQVYVETIRLHYKKDRTMEDAYKEAALRRENPALDQMLYDADKADVLHELSEVKGLLAKLARGEELTEQEKQFLEAAYPGCMDDANQSEDQAEVLRKRFEQQALGYSVFEARS